MVTTSLSAWPWPTTTLTIHNRWKPSPQTPCASSKRRFRCRRNKTRRQAMAIKRIAINTGGGDAPGLNAVIRAVVLAASKRGWECIGIRDGYQGLLDKEAYPDGGYRRLTREDVRGITHLGGTILGTTNRGNPLSYPVENEDGTIRRVDRTQVLVDAFNDLDIDALVAIGGDGSMRIAHALAQKGLHIVGVPKTIDNDLSGTSVTFGF